jgi:hypothetical protein
MLQGLLGKAGVLLWTLQVCAHLNALAHNAIVADPDRYIYPRTHSLNWNVPCHFREDESTQIRLDLPAKLS